jgi:hypothetical protein
LGQKDQHESRGLDDPESVVELVVFSCLSIFFFVGIADRNFGVNQYIGASSARSMRWRF